MRSIYAFVFTSLFITTSASAWECSNRQGVIIEVGTEYSEVFGIPLATLSVVPYKTKSSYLNYEIQGRDEKGNSFLLTISDVSNPMMSVVSENLGPDVGRGRLNFNGGLISDLTCMQVNN